MCVSRLILGYAGIVRILVYVCRHILRYAGPTVWCVVQEQGRPDYPTFIGRWSGIYRSRVWPTVLSGIQKSANVSHPYNQGRKHPSMVAEWDGRVHSGGLPTLTVHKYRA
jgi:hypothetical protein